MDANNPQTCAASTSGTSSHSSHKASFSRPSSLSTSLNQSGVDCKRRRPMQLTDPVRPASLLDHAVTPGALPMALGSPARRPGTLPSLGLTAGRPQSLQLSGAGAAAGSGEVSDPPAVEKTQEPVKVQRDSLSMSMHAGSSGWPSACAFLLADRQGPEPVPGLSALAVPQTGAFSTFASRYTDLCEYSTASDANAPGGTVGSQPSPRYGMNSLSQPCLPLSSAGPTRILPFMYLGSQQDALDHGKLKMHRIEYVLNLSITCPRPEFVPDTNFMRIPINDSYQEKLLPYFEKAFQFLDKVRESQSSVLVHCLAGISRSPSLAIAYIMSHLHMSSEEAYTYVKAKRPSISPNFNFMGQLLEFEKQLRAKRGHLVAQQLRVTMRKSVVASHRQSVNSARCSHSPSVVSANSGTSGYGSQRASALSTNTNANANARLSDFANAGGTLDQEDNGAGYLRRSFSLPIKAIHKSASETRLAPIVERVQPQNLGVSFGGGAIKGRPWSEVNQRDKNTSKFLDGAKMERTDSSAETFLDAAEPAAIPNQYGKREMMDIGRRDLPSSSMVQPNSKSGVPGTNITGGTMSAKSRRVLSIPQPVAEDLPSPSTEMAAKLSFMDVQLKQTQGAGESGERGKDCGLIQGAVSVSNPFFTVPLESHSFSGGSPQRAAPTTSSASNSARGTAHVCTKVINSLLPSLCAVARNPSSDTEPVLVSHRGNSADVEMRDVNRDSSVVNPFFEGSVAQPVSAPTAPPGSLNAETAGDKLQHSQHPSTSGHGCVTPGAIQGGDTLNQPEYDSAAGTSGLSTVSTGAISFPRRLWALVRPGASVTDARGSNVSGTGSEKRVDTPRSITVEHLCTLQHDPSSAHPSHPPYPAIPPPKSKSETVLCALDSPESGYVESSPLTKNENRDMDQDRDKDSMGSTSSLEIAVIS